MDRFTLFLVCGVLGLAYMAARGADAPQTVTLGEDKGLTIRLTYARVARLTDREFLKLEFDNTTGHEAPLEWGDWYQISYESFDLVTKRALESGNIASGGILGERALGHTGPARLSVGKTTNVKQVSEAAAASLGLPSEAGALIKAHIMVQIKVQGEATQRQLQQDFTFQWKRPDAKGMERLRKELRAMLAEKSDQAGPTYLLWTMLRAPDIAEGVPTTEYLKSLDVLKGSWSGRDWVLRYLAEHRANDSAVVQHYQRKLAAQDVGAVEDLCGAPEIWDDGFVADLVAIALGAHPGGPPKRA